MKPVMLSLLAAAMLAPFAHAQTPETLAVSKTLYAGWKTDPVFSALVVDQRDWQGIQTSADEGLLTATLRCTGQKAGAVTCPLDVVTVPLPSVEACRAGILGSDYAQYFKAPRNLPVGAKTSVEFYLPLAGSRLSPTTILYTDSGICVAASSRDTADAFLKAVFKPIAP